VLCCVGDHLFRTFTLWMGPDSDSTKLPTTPRQQLRRGGGITKINSCRNDLFQVTFKTKRFCVAFYEFYSSSYMFTHIRYRGVGQIDSKKSGIRPLIFHAFPRVIISDPLQRQFKNIRVFLSLLVTFCFVLSNPQKKRKVLPIIEKCGYFLLLTWSTGIGRICCV
jgi:hypothetical protein